MEYQLFNRDCFDFIGLLPDKSIDLIITDPPYEHVSGGMKSKVFNTGTWRAESYMNVNMVHFKKEDIFRFLDMVIPKMKKINMYIFCSRLQLAHYFDYINQHKKIKYDLLIWDKSSSNGKYTMKSTKFYTSDIEYIIRLYEGGVSLNKVQFNGNIQSTYYMKRQKFSQPRGLHESMKPVNLIEQYVLLSSNEGDVVADFFMGSNSTGIAAIKNNRKYIGVEIDSDCFKIAKSRVDDFILK